jgi:hypothetical protein
VWELAGSLLHQLRSYVISETPSIALAPLKTLVEIITVGSMVA